MGRTFRGRTSYQSTWVKEFPWVKPVPKDPHKASCELCGKAFAVDSMGKQALTSHARTQKHKAMVSASTTTPPANSYLDEIPSNSAAAKSLPVKVTSPSSSTAPIWRDRVLTDFQSKDLTTQREIIWCLGAVMDHDSLRKCANKMSLFQFMFKAVEDVQALQLSKSKIAYVIVYGIGYFFKKELSNTVKDKNHIAVGFDESFNKIAKKQQMDLMIRFWNDEKDEVSTRYFNSIFLEHSTAEDLLLGLVTTFDEGNLKKIIQLAMDGPNVNFKLMKLFREMQQAEPDNPDLLDIGSCGIHTMHNGFKAGIKSTNWCLLEFLRALYNLFNFSPARRGDFTEITKSSIFPLKFCAVRWLENTPVAKRAEEILPDVIKYVKAIEGTPKEPKLSSSFETVKNAVKDQLLPAKLAFFQSLAEEVEPFMREYQTDSPLAPFLFDTLKTIVDSSVRKLVKPEVLAICVDRMKIDLNKKENLVLAKNFDIGHSTKKAIRNCKGVKDKYILEFREQAKTCVKVFVEKIILRSPIKYPLTKALSCLDPKKIVSEDASRLLTNCLEILVRQDVLSGRTADKVEREFREFSLCEEVRGKMAKYSRVETRLDHFYMRVLSSAEDQQRSNLRDFVQLVLILFHGNASLERGFSINKECLVENLTEDSLVRIRHVYSAVSEAGGIEQVNITKSMIHAARNAHSMYKEALSKKARETQTSQQKEKEDRKRALQEKRDLAVKRQKFLDEIKSKELELEVINKRAKLI